MSRIPARIFPCISFALAAALLLAGCPSTVTRQAATALSEMEQVDFNFLVLQADASGKYTLHLPIRWMPVPAGDQRGVACPAFKFDRVELATLLSNGEWTVTAGGMTLTPSFDFQMLEQCFPPRANDRAQFPPEVKIVNDELSISGVDASGAATRARPFDVAVGHLVNTRLNDEGRFEFRHWTKGVNLIGATESRAREPGPLTLTSIEISASLVGSAGDEFKLENLTSDARYSAAAVTHVLTNPRRFTGTFSFLAGQPGETAPVLLVWDGDMVLRTDI